MSVYTDHRIHTHKTMTDTTKQLFFHANVAHYVNTINKLVNELFFWTESEVMNSREEEGIIWFDEHLNELKISCSNLVDYFVSISRILKKSSSCTPLEFKLREIAEDLFSNFTVTRYVSVINDSFIDHLIPVEEIISHFKERFEKGKRRFDDSEIYERVQCANAIIDFLLKADELILDFESSGDSSMNGHKSYQSNDAITVPSESKKSK